MELATRALALAPSAGQCSGRVRDVPDVRMIRYYTTIGLIDRPAEMAARTAFYGPQHLRQLVAIKRLQGQGMSLVEIQESLAGAGAKKLDQLAALPPGFIKAALATDPQTRREPLQQSSDDVVAVETLAAKRRRFWSAVPEVSEENAPAEPGGMLAPQTAVILPLDVGVSLVLKGVTPEQLKTEIVASLQPAVAVLRDALVRAGLRSTQPES